MAAPASYDAATVKAMDQVEEIFLQEIIMAKFDPYHVLGVDYHERGQLTPGQLRQRIRTNFRTYLDQIIMIRVDATGLLDYHRSPAFENFLRSALQELGHSISAEPLLVYAQGKGPQEVRDAINAQVPASELILLEANRQEKMLQFRVNLCRCVQEKSQQDHLEMSVPAVSSTLDNVYDAVMDHLNRSGALPRGFDVLLLIRFRIPPNADSFVDVLLSRTNNASPYKWRIQLSNITTSTASVAQHILDQVNEGAVPRFKDLGAFFPTTEIYACLSNARAQGPAKSLKHSATNFFIVPDDYDKSSPMVVEAPPPSVPAKADGAPPAATQVGPAEEGAAATAVGTKRKIADQAATSAAGVSSSAAGGGGGTAAPAGPGGGVGGVPLAYPKSSGPRCTVCGEPARFKPPGGNKFVDGYCGRHAKSTMVDIRGPVCEFAGCVRAGAPVAKRATYAFKGESRPRRCSEHREHGMIDIVHKKPNPAGEEGGGGEPAPKKARPHTGGAKPRGQTQRPDQGQDDMANTAVEALFTLRQGPPAGGGGGGRGPGADGLPGAAMAGVRPSDAVSMRTIEDLANKLSHRDKEVRCEALRGLAARGSEVLGPYVVKIAQGLKDTDTDVRKLTLEVLSKLHVLAAEAIIQSGLLRDRNPDIQRWALYALGQLGRASAAHIEEISSLLTAEDKGLRQWSAYALGQVVGPDNEPYEKVLPQLMECLKEDDTILRQHVVDATRKLDWQGKYVDKLASMLDLDKERDIKVLTSVLTAMESYGERAAAHADKLAGLLGSNLSENAASALSKLGIAAITSLGKAHSLSSTTPQTRVAALHVLRDLGHTALPHAGIIKPLLADTDASVRGAAVEALAKIGGSQGLFLEDFGGMIRDPNPEVQEKVLAAFHDKDQAAKNFIPRIVELIEDHWDQKIRRLALEALNHLQALVVPYVERIVGLLCDEQDADLVNGTILLLASRDLRDCIAPFAQRIYAALQEPAKKAIIRPNRLVAAEQLRLSCENVLHKAQGLAPPPAVHDAFPPAEPDPLDVIWGGKLLAIVVRPEVDQSLSQMDDGIYYVVRTPNSKNPSSPNKDTWELRRLCDEVEKVMPTDSTTNKSQQVSEISRPTWGGPSHFPGHIVSPIEFNTSQLSRGAHKPLVEDSNRFLRPERTIHLTFITPNSIRVRFEEKNREIVVDVPKAREMFMPIVEGPGWLYSFFKTWCKIRFCAGDYLALLMAMASRHKNSGATTNSTEGLASLDNLRGPDGTIPPIHSYEEKVPFEWFTGSLDRDTLAILSFFIVDSSRSQNFSVDDFLLFINAFHTPVQDVFQSAKQVQERLNAAMMEGSGVAIDFRPFPVARELLDQEGSKAKRVFFRVSDKYPVRLLAEFTSQVPLKREAHPLPLSLQWDTAHQRWAMEDPAIDALLTQQPPDTTKGTTELSRVASALVGLETRKDAELPRLLGTRTLSIWQQPLLAVVLQISTPTSALSPIEQGIYLELENGERGETWSHTLLRRPDEMGMVTGQRFSMLDGQLINFKGKILLDLEGTPSGDVATKGMRPPRSMALYWKPGGLLRLAFARDDTSTNAEVQHLCTEGEAQSFLTPIPMGEGWMENFLTNSPRRYCAGDYLALLQAAYLQYEQRLRRRSSRNAKRDEALMEEVFKTSNTKLPLNVLQGAFTPATLDIIKFFIVDLDNDGGSSSSPLPPPLPPSERLEFQVDDFLHFLNCFMTPYNNPFHAASELQAHLQHLLTERGPGTTDVFDFRNFARARKLRRDVPADPRYRNKDNIFFRMSDTKPLRVVMSFYDVPDHWQTVLSMPEPKIMSLKWDLVSLPEGVTFHWSVDESEIMDGIIKQAAGVVQGTSTITSLYDVARSFAAILEDRVDNSKSTLTEIMKMGSGTYIKRSHLPASDGTTTTSGEEVRI